VLLPGFWAGASDTAEHSGRATVELADHPCIALPACNHLHKMIAHYGRSQVASITIRRLDDRLKSELKHRAAQHGCSMEEEARRILRDSLDRSYPENAADIALALFGPKHGIDLPPLPPIESPDPPDFGGQ
jgi:plasmid stability protein